MASTVDKLLHVDEDLRIKEELVGLHAINPFIAHCSSARGIMLSSHFSQSVVLDNGEEKIIQTGLEKQFGENTFSKKAETDLRIIKIIDRYNSIDYDGINAVVEKLFIVENLETGEIDCIEIPYYHSLHQYFGFKYKIDPNMMEELKPGSILPKGTILADSPSVTENSGYKFGVNGNLCLINLPETTEDGVVISKSFADRLAYTIFEKRVVEFGSDSYPLNIYGDENNYKPFPDIGEYVNDESVIMVLREYNERLSPALTSVNDVKNFDPLFDKAMYVKSPGQSKYVNGKPVNYGRVVDIKAYSINKPKKEVYTGTADCIKKYVVGLKKYYNDILAVYNHLTTDKFRNKPTKKDIPLSENFRRLIIEAMSIANPNNDTIEYKFKNEKLNLYRIEFTIEYTCVPTVGAKLSNLHGAKGVIVQIRDDKDMPYSKDGRYVADLIMDPGSVVSRLNVSRVYEQYFNASSRVVRNMVRDIIGDSYLNYFEVTYNGNDAGLDKKKITKDFADRVNRAFEVVLDYLKIFDNEQYYGYCKVTSFEEKFNIIWECVTKEVYVLYRVSDKKPAYTIAKELSVSPFAPPQQPIMVKIDGEFKDTKENILIAPEYNILLSKIANSAISTSSSKLNHYGLPISVTNTNKYRKPYKESALKNLSETENRLFMSYAGRKAVAELKDRAVSLNTHEAIYRNILNADVPTNIDDVVDRNTVDYTGDAAMELVNNILNCAGTSIDYVDGKGDE